MQSCAKKLAGKGVDVAIMNAGVFVGGPDDPLKGGSGWGVCCSACGSTAHAAWQGASVAQRCALP